MTGAHLSIGGVHYELTGSPRVIDTGDGIVIDLGHLSGDGAPVLITAPSSVWLRVLEVDAWAGRVIADRDARLHPAAVTA